MQFSITLSEQPNIALPTKIIIAYLISKNLITSQVVESTSFFDNNNIVDDSIEITSVFGNTILFTCA